MKTGGETFVVIGRITRPHALRGEVRVSPATDFPERFDQSNRFFIRNRENRGEWKNATAHRWQGGFVVMKFEGVDSREDAEILREATVEIPRDACHDLPEGTYYISDLIGLRVRTVSGTIIGNLADVLQQSAQDVYVIRTEGKEILVPAVRKFVSKIDIEKGEIVIDPIEGLLD